MSLGTVRQRVWVLWVGGGGEVILNRSPCVPGCGDDDVDDAVTGDDDCDEVDNVIKGIKVNCRSRLVPDMRFWSG